jgi:hypothetical protein
MAEIRAIGAVIYTYGILEDTLDQLWDWLLKVEAWSGHPYEEYVFSRRGKDSHRLWKMNAKNRERLFLRLNTEKPWFLVTLSWPKDDLKTFPIKTKGIQVTIKSWGQPWKRGEGYRTPSYVSILFHPKILVGEIKIKELLDLCAEAWGFTNGVYGFIDIETGIPLQDNLARNIDHLMSNLVPKEHFQEFYQWVMIKPELHRKIWKVFWCNLIGAGHIRQLGGYKELRKANPYQPESELLAVAYERGKNLLLGDLERYLALDRGGFLFTLCDSPMDWFDDETQLKKNEMQTVFNSIAINL